MSIIQKSYRRQFLMQLASSAAVIASPKALAQTKRVRLVLALPTMSPVLANQTSVPEALGYFAQEGIRVEPVLAGAGGTSGAAQLVATGDQDIGSGSYSPLLSRIAEGQNLGLQYFYQQVRTFSLAMAANADGSVKTPQDLKGKLIGVANLGSETIAMAKYVARSVGLNPDTDIRFIAIGGGAQAAQAIRSKQVDIIAAPRAQISQIESLGIPLHYLTLPTKLRDLFGPGLYTRLDYIEKNRSTVVSMGRAVAKGTLFMLTNPEAAIRLHWKAYPQQVSQSIAFDKALEIALKTLVVQIEGLRFQPHESVTRFGEFRAESIAAVTDVFGLSAKSADVSRLFSNDLISEINSFDRDAIIQQARSYKVS